MNRAPVSLRSPTSRSARIGLFTGLGVLLLATAAWAGDYAHAATHVTAKSTDHVLKVLTSYGETCHSGCRYYGPDVKQFVQLSHKKSDSSWFTWTWVSTTMKDVKYFSQVKRSVKPDGTILLVTRQLDEGDKALIAELTKATGKPHEPAFDKGKTVFVVRALEDGKTKVVQDMTMSASGMLDMFGDRIRTGMKEGAAVTFKNIEK